MSPPIRHASYQFCPACGTRFAKNKTRDIALVCTACSGVVYPDPKVVACVIVEIKDKILLVRRKPPRDATTWLLPGGYVDEGEPVEDAARREIQEETNLTIRLERLVGVFSYPDWPPVIIVYSARLDTGIPLAGAEIQTLGLFGHDEIPWNSLAFPSTRDALHMHIQGRSCQAQPLAVSLAPKI